MEEFQKLENPRLIHLDSENGVIIATEIDLSILSNKIIFFKGKYYNYDDGQMVGGNMMQVQYSLSQDAYFKLDENGEILD